MRFMTLGMPHRSSQDSPFPRQLSGDEKTARAQCQHNATHCEWVLQLNLSALKGDDSQATLRITTLTLAPEGSHRPHASGF